jgi:hypothetical protein
MTEQEFQTKVQDVLVSLQHNNIVGKDVYAAHYTAATTPRLMLDSASSNLMRQYDGDYMNDPEEGRYLVEIMIEAAKKCKHQSKGDFVEHFSRLRNSRLLYSSYKKCTFLSSWTQTTVKKQNKDACDSLNHWRFYGQDGKGAAILIPMKNLALTFKNQLFKVEYGVDQRGGGSASGGRAAKVLLDLLIKRLDALQKTKAIAMKELETVIQEMHPLLFLFKSNEYVSEKEIRSIVHKTDYDSTQNVKFDTHRETEPSQAYVESAAGLITSGSIIYFGPKSNQKYAIELMGKAANRSLKIDVYLSNMPYR